MGYIVAIFCFFVGLYLILRDEGRPENPFSDTGFDERSRKNVDQIIGLVLVCGGPFVALALIYW